MNTTKRLIGSSKLIVSSDYMWSIHIPDEGVRDNGDKVVRCSEIHNAANLYTQENSEGKWVWPQETSYIL